MINLNILFKVPFFLITLVSMFNAQAMVCKELVNVVNKTGCVFGSSSPRKHVDNCIAPNYDENLSCSDVLRLKSGKKLKNKDLQSNNQSNKNLMSEKKEETPGDVLYKQSQEIMKKLIHQDIECSGKIDCSLSCYKQLNPALSHKFQMPGKISGYTFIGRETPYVVFPSVRNDKKGFYSFEFGKSEGTFVAYSKTLNEMLKNGEHVDVVVDRNNYRNIATAKINLTDSGSFNYYTYEKINSNTLKVEKGNSRSTIQNKTEKLTTSEHNIRDNQTKEALNKLLADTIQTLKPNDNSYAAKMSGQSWYGKDREKIIKGINHCLKILKDQDLKQSLIDLSRDVCTNPGAPESGCPNNSSKEKSKNKSSNVLKH